MRNRIYVQYRPFDVLQRLDVYDDMSNSIIDTMEVPIDEVQDTITMLKMKYQVKAITLHGNKEYLSKFRNELASKYDNIEVTIL